MRVVEYMSLHCRVFNISSFTRNRVCLIAVSNNGSTEHSKQLVQLLILMQISY